VMTVEGCICLPVAAQSRDLAGVAASAATWKIICTEHGKFCCTKM